MNSFNQEYTTIWSFKERGQWATHKGDYPGNCSPYVVKNLLIKYSNKDDVVLDQFVGSGTTVIESLLLNRKAIGVDINEKALSITKSRIKDIDGKYKLIKGDATKLTLQDKSVDFILSMFFELISFEFNTLEIILKKANPNGIYGLSS